MYYEIYVDSFLIQEVIVNFYVLMLCKLCLMCTATHKRIFFASICAGIYQLVLLFIPFPNNVVLFYISIFLFYAIGSFMTIVIAFGKNKGMVCLKQMIMYFAIMLMVGGIFMGILPRFSFYNRSKVKPLIFLIFGGILYGVLFFIFSKKRQNTYYGKLKLLYQDICLEGQYFVDSGNGIVESISGKPVILADEKWFREILKAQGLMCRPVIYKSVGKSKGILYAYCVDKLVIYGEVKTYTYEKVWVGVCREKLLEDQKCQVILPLFYGQI